MHKAFDGTLDVQKIQINISQPYWKNGQLKSKGILTPVRELSIVMHLGDRKEMTELKSLSFTKSSGIKYLGSHTIHVYVYIITNTDFCRY